MQPNRETLGIKVSPLQSSTSYSHPPPTVINLIQSSTPYNHPPPTKAPQRENPFEVVVTELM